MNKKVLIFLGASLAVNFVFIGFEASRMKYQQSGFPSDRPGMPDGLKSLGFKVIQNMKEDEFVLHTKEMHEAMRKAKVELNKDPFDEDGFREALQEAAQARITLDKTVEEKMVEILSKMPPEERRRFAKEFGRRDRFFKERSRRRKMGSRQAAGRRRFFWPSSSAPAAPEQPERTEQE